MTPKRPSIARRAWSMRADAPSHTHVDFDPTESPSAPAEVSPKVLDPATVVDWRGSSFDLLNGVEVRDHSDSIPDALFDRLFKK